MTAEEYIAKARSDGRTITNEYVNGIDYVFIVESDGWVSIIERSECGYRPLLQAANRQKAIDYIVMRETIPVSVNII